MSKICEIYALIKRDRAINTLELLDRVKEIYPDMTRKSLAQHLRRLRYMKKIRHEDEVPVIKDGRIFWIATWRRIA